MKKVVITCQITYISPHGRISERKATGIGLSGSRKGPRNQTAGVEVSSAVSSSSALDDSPPPPVRSLATPPPAPTPGPGQAPPPPPPPPPPQTVVQVKAPDASCLHPSLDPSWVHPSLDPCLAPTRNSYRSPHQHPSVASFFCTVRRPIVEVRRPASFFNHLQLKIVNQSAHIYKTIV